MLKAYDVELKGPFNYSARDEAGLPREWYEKSSADSKNTKQEKEQLSVVRSIYEIFSKRDIADLM